MGKNIYIIFDVSGSMSGERKRGIIKNLMVTIQNVSSYEKYKDFVFDGYLWNEAIIPFRNVEHIEWNGKNDINSLNRFIMNADDNSHFVLVSDGSINSSDADIIKKSLQRKQDYMFTIGVGADCDSEMLRSLCRPRDKYFQAYLVMTCLESICFDKLVVESEDKGRRRYLRRINR